MCNAGFTGADGGTCSACVAGTYKTSSGSVACTDCAAGTFSATAGTITCPVCATGGVSAAGSTACQFYCAAGSTGLPGACALCVAGKYKTSAGSAVCSDCGAGTYSVTVGATDAGVCVACPGDSHSPSSSSAGAACLCNAGYSGANGGTCSVCVAGSFKASNGSAACELCPNNTFSAGIGRRSACEACQTNAVSVAGSVSQASCYCKAGHAHAVGMLTCVECNRGTWNSQLGRSACSNCSVGEYSVNYGAIGRETCVACPLGQWSPEGSPNCNVCPANSRAAAGGASLESCVCDAGYTGADGSPCAACGAGTYKAAAGSAACSTCPALMSSPGGARSLPECWCVTGYIEVAGACAAMAPGAVVIHGSLAGITANSSAADIASAIAALRASIALRLNIPIELVQITRTDSIDGVRVSIFGRSPAELSLIDRASRLATTAPTVSQLPFTLVTRAYTNTSVLAEPRALVVHCRLLNLTATESRRLLQAASNVIGDALEVLRLEMRQQFNVRLVAVRVHFDDVSADNTLWLELTIDVSSEQELEAARGVASALEEQGSLVLTNAMVLLIYDADDAGPSGLNFSNTLVRADGTAMPLEEVQAGQTLSLLQTQLSLYYGVPESAVEVRVVVVDGVYSVETVVLAVHPATLASLQEMLGQASPALDVATVALALPFEMANIDVSYASVPAAAGVSVPNAVVVDSELVHADGTPLSGSEAAAAAATLRAQMIAFFDVDASQVQVELVPARNPAVSAAPSVRVVVVCAVGAVDGVFERAQQMPATAGVRVLPVAFAGLGGAVVTAVSGQMVDGQLVECAANHTVHNGTCQCAAGFVVREEGTCTACAAGTYGADAGSSVCTACPADTFSLGAATACRACPANAVSVAGSASADACGCSAGYIFSTPARRACVACPANTEATSAAATVCAGKAGFCGLGYALADVARSCGGSLTEACATLSNGATSIGSAGDGALDGSAGTYVRVVFGQNLARSCGNTGTTACATTAGSLFRPWWGVDFGRRRSVFAVNVMSSNWANTRDFKVVVGDVADAQSPLNAVCADYLVGSGSGYVKFTCEDTVSGRYVYVVNGPHAVNYLILSEVVVEAFNYSANPALLRPWWAVDFAAERAVAGVVIQAQAAGVIEVRVGHATDPLQNAVCANGALAAGANSTIPCVSAMAGRYLFVVGAGNSVLALNDVRVLGIAAAPCPADTFKPLAGNASCTACPAFSTSGVGATSVAQCACRDGYLDG